jgi:hypothetical protein
VAQAAAAALQGPPASSTGCLQSECLCAHSRWPALPAAPPGPPAHLVHCNVASCPHRNACACGRCAHAVPQANRRAAAKQAAFIRKAQSLAASAFASALLLDADNLPLANPEGWLCAARAHSQQRALQRCPVVCCCRSGALAVFAHQLCRLLLQAPVRTPVLHARGFVCTAALWRDASFQQAGNLCWPDFWGPFVDADKEDIACDMLGLDTHAAMVRRSRACGGGACVARVCRVCVAIACVPGPEPAHHCDAATSCRTERPAPDDAPHHRTPHTTARHTRWPRQAAVTRHRVWAAAAGPRGARRRGRVGAVGQQLW